MRLSSFVPVVLAFAGAAGGAFVAAQLAVGLLETNSQEAVAFELELQGFEWTEVQADGLQVILSGEAPSEARRFAAMSVSGTVVDAARVIDDIAVADTQEVAPPRFSVEILRNDAGVSLIGLIPAASDRDDFVNRVTRITGGSGVTDLLEVADYSVPENWEGAVDYALAALRDLPRSKISIEAGAVAVKAITDSEAEQRRIEAELFRNAPDTVQATLEISAPRPVISPFTLRFLIDDRGARFDACSAHTESEQSKILAAAVTAGLAEKTDCRLGLGSPSAAWGDVAANAIVALRDVGAGSVTISDTDITLIAREGTDPKVFASASATLEDSLPDLFSITSVLPKPIQEGEVGPAELTASLHEDGSLMVRGNTGDALASRALETYAQARFGAQQVTVNGQAHPDLPSGWSMRALAALAALAELNTGSVQVGADHVSLSGVSGNENAPTRIAQVLSQQLGEGQEYAIDVTYDEALDPLANIPTPEECAQSIETVAQQGRIKFEPGSDTLDGDSQDTIRQIADIVRSCPELPLLVAGHTDSQGREEMNLALSQSRAEAVIEALRALRLPVPNFEARGFGEATPIADNGTEEGREANRRIEFALILPQAEAPVETPPTNSEEAPSE